jgi:hypothetical protein
VDVGLPNNPLYFVHVYNIISKYMIKLVKIGNRSQNISHLEHHNKYDHMHKNIYQEKLENKLNKNKYYKHSYY